MPGIQRGALQRWKNKLPQHYNSSQKGRQPARSRESGRGFGGQPFSMAASTPKGFDSLGVQKISQKTA
jgi:hypothetical protein